MRILHINEQHDLVKAGVSTAANSVMRQIAQGGGEAQLLTVGAVEMAPPNVTTTAVPLATGKIAGGWRWGERLPARISETVAAFDPDVIHVHGIWMAPQILGAKAAAARGIAAILTNHGMLEPWSLAQPGRLGSLRKKLYLASVARWGFSDLSAFHAITPLERDQLASLFPRHRIEVIPNSIDLAPITPRPRPTDAGDDYILFFGRLHPKKGADLLIQAFLAARFPKRFKLLIAGPTDGAAYFETLQRLARDGIADGRIEFLGPIWDEAEKLALMQHAHVVVVPSHSEVVALVNLEAAGVGTPTLTTRETGLLDWEEGGGMLVGRDVASLTAGLEVAAAWTESERNARGLASYDLAHRRYSTVATQPMWLQLYDDLARTG